MVQDFYSPGLPDFHHEGASSLVSPKVLHLIEVLRGGGVCDPPLPNVPPVHHLEVFQKVSLILRCVKLNKQDRATPRASKLTRTLG